MRCPHNAPRCPDCQLTTLDPLMKTYPLTLSSIMCQESGIVLQFAPRNNSKRVLIVGRSSLVRYMKLFFPRLLDTHNSGTLLRLVSHEIEFQGTKYHESMLTGDLHLRAINRFGSFYSLGYTTLHNWVFAKSIQYQTLLLGIHTVTNKGR